MGLIDSHCHLDDERFAEDSEAVIERAQAAGVSHMMSIEITRCPTKFCGVWNGLQ